jgi:adenosine/AMP kinase
VEDAGGEITIQLFADNEKVEGEEVILNSTTGYDYTFEDLLVFKTDSSTEIKYDVRLLEDGKYRRLSEKNATHEKATIKKWVQVLPEDIKAGHTYVIITNNLNWQSNGFSKIIYLRGDVTAKGANVVPEYILLMVSHLTML